MRTKDQGSKSCPQKMNVSYNNAEMTGFQCPLQSYIQKAFVFTYGRTHTCTHEPWCTLTVGIHSLPPPCGFQGSSWGQQAWQAPAVWLNHFTGPKAIVWILESLQMFCIRLSKFLLLENSVREDRLIDLSLKLEQECWVGWGRCGCPWLCFRVTDVSEREGGAASSAPVSMVGSRMPWWGVCGVGIVFLIRWVQDRSMLLLDFLPPSTVISMKVN